MRRLKELVHDETGISPEHQRLLYGAKQMEDDKRLGDYPPLGNGASILLVLRLPGGGNMFSSSNERDNDNSAPQGNDDAARSRSERHSVIDKSIPRSDEDCMISLVSGESVRMPCEHPITPDALLDYCWSEIASLKYEIKCPLCSSEWSLDVIKRYGGTSDVELRQLEEGIARNACRRDPKIQKCPFCGVFCERQNSSVNSVICILCSKNGENKVFCWRCLRPWNNPSMTAVSCGNAQCEVNRDKLKQLEESPMVVVGYLKERKQIYKLRACPGCATLIEHDGGCKQMTCKKCKTEFCFICLCQRDSCGRWQCGFYNSPCELAPIQEVLPQ